jgi:regulator of sigma D
LLRRLDITYGELDPIARGHFDIYARTIAKIEVADAWFEQNGYIHDKGAQPQVAMNYTSLLNTASRALERLSAHLQQRPAADPFAKYRTIDAVQDNGD